MSLSCKALRHWACRRCIDEQKRSPDSVRSKLCIPCMTESALQGVKDVKGGVQGVQKDDASSSRLSGLSGLSSLLSVTASFIKERCNHDPRTGVPDLVVEYEKDGVRRPDLLSVHTRDALGVRATEKEGEGEEMERRHDMAAATYDRAVACGTALTAAGQGWVTFAERKRCENRQWPDIYTLERYVNGRKAAGNPVHPNRKFMICERVVTQAEIPG